MTQQAAITVSGVSKSFRVYHEVNRSLKATVLRGRRARFEEFPALSDVDLEIPQGKTFGLLGNNGSGKSTLLKCIAKILVPNKGTIASRGRLAAMLEVGSGFHPELSGRENVYLNGAILGMSKAEIDSKFDSIVDFSGVEGFIDQPVKNYSSGMYVRLGFAVSIHVEPDILLVDEVLAVGDLPFQEKCTAKFADLRAQDRTVVVVSHAVEKMRTFCDLATWLRKGRVAGVGKADDIITQYSESAFKDAATKSPAPPTAAAAKVLGVDAIPDERGDSVRPGEGLTLRLRFECRRPIAKPIFGMTVLHESGFVVWGQNTFVAEYPLPPLEPGTGSIELRIPRVHLRPGHYRLGGRIAREEDPLGAIDTRPGIGELHVGATVPSEAAGVIEHQSLFGNFTVTSGASGESESVV